jgi:hypothetical protein
MLWTEQLASAAAQARGLVESELEGRCRKRSAIFRKFELRAREPSRSLIGLQVLDWS